MNRTVAKMLGEGAVDVAEPSVAPPEQSSQLRDYTNPSVQQLVALWQEGSHEAVALRVLDALDHYEDFVQLAFQLGHEGAIELGQLMDRQTADQHSPHNYDKVPDQDIGMKGGKRPEPADVQGAIGTPE